MKNAFSLDGKRILVTGASSGIGRACAVLASELGASLVLTGRRADALAETQRLAAGPDRHVFVPGDLASPDFVRRLVETAGPLDGLVHAAGACKVVPIGLADAALAADALAVGYFAFIELMRHCTRGAHANGGFSAVAVSSVSAEAGWPGGALYAGGKGALGAAVRALAIELAPKRMRVNAVCPGCIRTPMSDCLARLTGGASAAAARQPLGIGEPEEVAAPVCFLLSDAARFVTGVNLPVDGGYLAQ